MPETPLGAPPVQSMGSRVPSQGSYASLSSPNAQSPRGTRPNTSPRISSGGSTYASYSTLGPTNVLDEGAFRHAGQRFCKSSCATSATSTALAVIHFLDPCSIGFYSLAIFSVIPGGLFWKDSHRICEIATRPIEGEESRFCTKITYTYARCMQCNCPQ